MPYSLHLTADHVNILAEKKSFHGGINIPKKDKDKEVLKHELHITQSTARVRDLLVQDSNDNVREAVGMNRGNRYQQLDKNCEALQTVKQKSEIPASSFEPQAESNLTVSKSKPARLHPVASLDLSKQTRRPASVSQGLLTGSDSSIHEERKHITLSKVTSTLEEHISKFAKDERHRQLLEENLAEHQEEIPETIRLAVYQAVVPVVKAVIKSYKKQLSKRSTFYEDAHCKLDNIIKVLAPDFGNHPAHTGQAKTHK